MTIRRTQIVAAGGQIISRIPLACEPEPRPCDHHWEWINDQTIRCLRCFECKEGSR